MPCPGYEEVIARHRRGPVKRFRIIHGPHRIALAPARKTDDFDINLDSFPRIKTTPLGEQSAIDFFTSRTLPTLAKYSPGTKLWTIHTFTRLIADAKIRNVVIAIGIAHQDLLRHFGPSVPSDDGLGVHSGNSSDSGSPSDPVDGDQYYNASLAYMRIDISSVRENVTRDRMDVAVACLLIVIYLSLQDRMEEAAVHMHCGLDIISETGETFLCASPVHQEIYLMFIHIATSSWPIHPNAALYDIIQATTKLSCFLTDLTPLQTIRADFDFFAHRIFQYTSAVTRGSFTDNKDMLIMRAALLEESELLSAQLDTYTSSMQDIDPNLLNNRAEQMFAKLLKARLDLYKIFSQCVNTRYQTTYDRYNQLFDEAVELVWSVLPDGVGIFGPDWHLFSSQLNVIGTLRQINLLCRHPGIRRKSLKALQYCPQREGIIEASEGRQIASLVMDFEEAGLDMDPEAKFTTPIPEENRLHFVECLRLSQCGNVDVADGEMVIRMMYRPDGDSGYVERRVKVAKESNRMPIRQMISI